MGINAKTLSQKLEAYRLESGYSQDLMGKLTGVSQQTYYNIEKSEPKKLDPIFIEKANKLVCNNPDESQLELIRMEASKGKRKKTLSLNNGISEEKPPKTPHNITKESSKTIGENLSGEEKEDVGSSSTKFLSMKQIIEELRQDNRINIRNTERLIEMAFNEQQRELSERSEGVVK